MFTRTELADRYYFSDTRAFNNLVRQTALPTIMPKILKRKATLLNSDLPIIEEHLGKPEDYLSRYLLKKAKFVPNKQ